MKKLCLVVLVREMNRSPCLAERKPERPELSATVQAMLLKYIGPVPWTSSKVCSAILNYISLGTGTGSQRLDVAKNQCRAIFGMPQIWRTSELSWHSGTKTMVESWINRNYWL